MLRLGGRYCEPNVWEDEQKGFMYFFSIDIGASTQDFEHEPLTKGNFCQVVPDINFVNQR